MSGKRTATATSVALLMCSVAAPAVARDGGARQSFDLTFTTERPAASTGFSEAIDYVNPQDRNEKPPAVREIVVRLARGSEVDTTVPRRCDAPDPVLILRGAAACPAGSVVGAGEVDLDTGVPGPGRILRNEVTLLNDRDELIFLFRERLTGRRLVSRAEVGHRSFRTEVPPIPGGPPDGFAAIDRVALQVDPVSRGRGARRESYITTPATCPRGRTWVNRGTFTYRDGVTQTDSSRSSCRRCRV